MKGILSAFLGLIGLGKTPPPVPSASNAPSAAPTVRYLSRTSVGRRRTCMGPGSGPALRPFPTTEELLAAQAAHPGRACLVRAHPRGRPDLWGTFVGIRQ